MIRFRNTKNGPQDKRFLRGYGFQGGGGDELQLERARLRRGVQEGACSTRVIRFGLAGLRRVPALLRELRRDRQERERRRSASPSSRSTWSWGDNEKKMIPDMAESAAEIMEAAGGQEHPALHGAWTACPATASTRWASRAWARTRRRRCSTSSSRPTTSSNLFVMDAAGFTSGRLPEPDAHHHGPHRPLDRLPARRDEEGHPLTREIGVALIGYAFMGRAHSNAYRQVGPSMGPRLRPA